ncbi:MAG TPA: N-acetylneuraminate synthase [Candidatus Limnocylindria bacterium]|nr:N-acetylneuraminate synthase [Candidatus Limnocylindria bacterium]
MRQVNSRTFVIAEAGVNHNGDPALARALVDVAVAAGADAVKFQTFTVDRLLTRHAAKAAYQQRATGSEQSQYEMLARLELSPSDHEMLFARCAAAGIEFMSTPFDPESARYLKQLGVRRLKISSGDVTNLPMLEVVGALGLPVILSTGMADMAEVEAAVATLRGAGTTDLAVLQCVSDYPADPGLINLKVMDTFARAFGTPVGLSDHSTGLAMSIAAVARGAAYIEKHFTLERGLPGPDHQASLLPDELRALVAAIRDVEAALGDGVKRPAASELPVRDVARKSLVAARDLPGGVVLTREDLDVLRPGTGLSPAALPAVLGRRTARAIAHHTPITEDMLKA